MTTGASISVCAMPRPAPRLPWPVVIGVALVLPGGMLAAIAAGIEPWLVWVAGGAGFVVLVVINTVTLISFARRRRLIAHLTPNALNEHERVFIGIDRETPLFVQNASHMWQWQTIRAHCRLEDVAPPHTVVQKELADTVTAIETPAHLLEPEPILPSSHIGPMTIAFCLLFVLVNAASAIISGFPWIALVWLAIGAAIALATPSMRDRFRIIRSAEGKVLAGQGWIRNRRGRIWRAGEAAMIVTSPFGKPPLHIIITGPCGIETLTFMHERDPDFVKLWQRWNHPDPRPELADA